MRCLDNPVCHRITIVAAAAGGKSTIGEVFSAYVISEQPGFFVWFAPTEAAAKEFADTRLNQVFKNCDAIKRRMPHDRHKIRNTGIIFDHMSYLVLPANITAAQSKHIRYMVCDEPWLYKPGMLSQLHKRTTKFAHNRKIIELSTGSILGDETEQAFQAGTKREWMFRCPECDNSHVPLFSPERLDENSYVKWSRDAKKNSGEWDFDAVRKSVVYVCPNCKHEFVPSDSNQYALNNGGGYTPAADSAEHQSFHWPAWASDFRLLGDFAVEFLQARAALKRGTTELLQEFTQKRHALAWDASLVDKEPVNNIAGDYQMGDPWADAQGRFMAVDVQKTHLWATIRDWKSGPETRLVWAGRIETWDEARAVQQEHGVIDQRVFVDSGHFTDTVYQQCCRFDWNAIKGEKCAGGFVQTVGDVKLRVPVLEANGEGVPMALPVDAVVKACALYRVSEEMTSERLHLFRTGRATGWTVPANPPKEYTDQMAARVRRARQNPRTGQTFWEWVTIAKCGEHLWDCERIQIAAAFLAGALDPEQQ
jgi:hypothetical protein